MYTTVMLGGKKYDKIPAIYAGVLTDLFEKGSHDPFIFEQLKRFNRGENPFTINVVVDIWIKKWKEYFIKRWDLKLIISTDEKQKIVNAMIARPDLPGLLIMPSKSIVTLLKAFLNLGQNTQGFRGINRSCWADKYELDAVYPNDRRQSDDYFLLHSNAVESDQKWANISACQMKTEHQEVTTMRITEYILMWDFYNFTNDLFLDHYNWTLCPESVDSNGFAARGHWDTYSHKFDLDRTHLNNANKDLRSREVSLI